MQFFLKVPLKLSFTCHNSLYDLSAINLLTFELPATGNSFIT